MGNQISYCHRNGVSYHTTMRKVEVLSLHGQTGQTGQNYRQPEFPATTTSTSPATNTVAAVLSITKRLEQTQLHDQTNTRVKSPVATPSTTPAADAALSTTELLEQILSHFDIKGLVLLRRVSRHWSDVMAESPVLQRVMFLAPDPELPFEWKLKYDPHEDLYIYTKAPSGTVSELDSDEQGFQPSRFNPLLFELRLDNGTDKTYSPLRSSRLYFRRSLEDVDAGGLLSRMLVTQPPITFAYVGCNTILVITEGIRVSDLIRAMKHDEDDYVCEAGHAFSWTASYVMFPTKDEEKKGQIVRQCDSLTPPCADTFADGGSLRLLTQHSASWLHRPSV